ncbi:MAG: hypothetical protein EBS42_01635, partial [Caulobacteraceae bacterium]|nr:hypothetical protein [Caulobacteraceae bacterium]
ARSIHQMGSNRSQPPHPPPWDNASSRFDPLRRPPHGKNLSGQSAAQSPAVAFVDEYLRSGSAREAAEWAGYRWTAARQAAHELMKRPNVRAAIEAGIAARDNPLTRPCCWKSAAWPLPTWPTMCSCGTASPAWTCPASPMPGRPGFANSATARPAAPGSAIAASISGWATSWRP